MTGRMTTYQQCTFAPLMEGSVYGRRRRREEVARPPLLLEGAPSRPFNPNDDVLTFSNGKWHRSVIRKAKCYGGSEWRYFVHYWGWATNFDEWVGSSRLHPYVRVSKEVQPLLPAPESKKKTLVKIEIPAALRRQLFVHCGLVAQENSKLKLPRSPNVQEILNSYMAYCSSNQSTDAQISLVVNGMLDYFDKALARLLLYPQERPQCEESQQVYPGLPPCQVYGVEHLVRMFVKLPELLTYDKLGEQDVKQLQARLDDMIKYISEHHQSSFLAA